METTKFNEDAPIALMCDVRPVENGRSKDGWVQFYNEKLQALCWVRNSIYFYPTLNQLFDKWGDQIVEDRDLEGRIEVASSHRKANGIPFKSPFSNAEMVCYEVDEAKLSWCVRKLNVSPSNPINFSIILGNELLILKNRANGARLWLSLVSLTIGSTNSKSTQRKKLVARYCVKGDHQAPTAELVPSKAQERIYKLAGIDFNKDNLRPYRDFGTFLGDKIYSLQNLIPTDLRRINRPIRGHKGENYVKKLKKDLNSSEEELYSDSDDEYMDDD